MIVVYNIILSIFFILFFYIPGIFLFRYLKFYLYNFSFPKKRYKIWIHCSSVGEVKMALRFIKKLCEMLSLSKEDILLTVITPTARNIAKKWHNDTYLFPIDYFLLTRKFVKKVLCKILIILETELWPNYIYYVNKYGGKIFILNGRISKNTFIWLNIFKFFYIHILNKIDYYLVREKIDYKRFQMLGIKNIYITGNMKYDDTEEIFEVSREEYGFKKEDFIFSFGSIREKEEKFVVEVVNKLKHLDIKFILVPRHLEIIPRIEKLLKKYNISFFRKSEIQNFSSNKNCQSLIVDTIGELKKFYYISDAVFVCGSILPYGGQNIIEPASLAKVVIFGPYINNFLEPATMLLANNGGIQVATIKELIDVIIELKTNPELRNRIANNAIKVIKSLKGATERNIEFIRTHI